MSKNIVNIFYGDQNIFLNYLFIKYRKNTVIKSQGKSVCFLYKPK